MQPLLPLLPSPRLLTLAANFWPRRLDEQRFPVEARLCRTEPDVQVLVHTQSPGRPPRGEIVLLHGMEGSSEAGYVRGMAQAALEAGFLVHRLNMRGCGGTEFLSNTMYHAGLTTDLFAFLMDLDRRRRTPVFVIGFSLGGNVVLKLAGELRHDAERLIAGLCAVSTPIDLAVCARCLGQPRNRLYEWWFLRRMKRRLRLRHSLMPDRFPVDGLDRASSLYEFDHRFTAPHFGFHGADRYYDTQSSQRFLNSIRVPTLLIQAKDDPLIPFHIFNHPALSGNPYLRLLAPDCGGHLGFICRRAPRFWLDGVVVAWMLELAGA